MIDSYTKVVLSVIAACLLVLVFRSPENKLSIAHAARQKKPWIRTVRCLIDKPVKVQSITSSGLRVKVTNGDFDVQVKNSVAIKNTTFGALAVKIKESAKLPVVVKDWPFSKPLEVKVKESAKLPVAIKGWPQGMPLEVKVNNKIELKDGITVKPSWSNRTIPVEIKKWSHSDAVPIAVKKWKVSDAINVKSTQGVPVRVYRWNAGTLSVKVKR